MKRSKINKIHQEAKACFEANGWALPPNPRWDITDFGLGEFDKFGLVLINLAEEPEYCEKLMYARKGQTTPAHTHKQKKEDIICRSGKLALELWGGHPQETEKGAPFQVQVNGIPEICNSGEILILSAGERITLTPGIYHAFWPQVEGCVIGEVSTANDDARDNVFVDPDVGRFPGIEEDEPPEVRLVSEG
ncbi:MAG: D-lyxose/D-mannose family sugar isomerase [Opitutales bacterium]